MNKFLILIVGLMLLSISLSALEPARISIVTTPDESTGQTLKVDILQSNGSVFSPVKTIYINDDGTNDDHETTHATTDASGTISFTLSHSIWIAIVLDATSKDYLVRITYGTKVLSIERMEVIISKQSLFSTHYIGQLYGGGVVFWVDQNGNHGLICSMVDLSPEIIWTSEDYLLTTVPDGALSDWDGQANTNAIVAQAGAGSTYAAGLCLGYTNYNYGTGVFNDWYLPSRGELIDLWNSLKAVQKALDSDGNAETTTITTQNVYWSSSEIDHYTAWYFTFRNGNVGDYYKSNPCYVRAVRAF